MDLICEERSSDSPFVETIWRSRSQQAGAFVSIATSRCAMVVTKYRDRTIITARGPETRATPAHCPAEAEFVGIQFKPGVFMPALPPSMVMDRRDQNLPEATSHSFWLNGTAWQFPNFENIDTFVAWLVRDGLLVREPVVDTMLHGLQPVAMSLRTAQRCFLRATGLTLTSLHQIECARRAAHLLKQGVSILDTVYDAGYFDQPHLTRSLKHFIGLTPALIRDTGREERLSFLYKTESHLSN